MNIAPSDIPNETNDYMRGVTMQKNFKYKFEWWIEGAEALAEENSLAVVIDILSFSTAVDVAVSKGAEIYPYNATEPGIENFAEKLDATIATKRGIGSITLSPPSMQNATKGQKIVLCSQNGAILSRAARQQYGIVIAASLRNANAVADFIKTLNPKTVCIIASGEKWEGGIPRFSIEDMIGAGAVLSHFERSNMSPEAVGAVDVFRGIGDFHNALSNCSSGRELIGKGFGDDVKFASMLDVSKSVPVLVNGAYKNKA